MNASTRAPSSSQASVVGSPGPMPVPQCVCATCLTPLPLPRASPSSTPYQCQHCRMMGTDMKVLYTRRAFPTEFSTR